ncbi:Uncharacterized protein FWK35_00000040 [Aphis craccivora]|uniref:Uncharacterized protein n=1 Tax=Aphis craccivora TaxID=307492 RepID=A0A6G0ZQA2_APHCR|nr:Uncharacterized protein FWK35_00000040 [Aphis craccivora]
MFFFLSVYSITSRNNSPISNFRGCFRWQSKYPWCNIEVKRKQKKKIKEKREFLNKTSFRPNRFFLFGCNSKTNLCKYMKNSPNFYVPYEFSNVYDICRKRENSQDKKYNTNLNIDENSSKP